MVGASAQQVTFDDLITRILARFASGTNAEVAAHIQTSLREIAEFVGADYAHIVRTATDRSSWSVAYEWCSPCAPSQMAQHQEVPLGSWGWIEQVLRAGQVLRVNCLEDMPPEAADVREQIRSVGFQSTLQVPFRGSGGQVNGCIALSSIVQKVTWVDADIQRLRLVGEAIANAMERARVEQELLESESRYRATFEHAPAGILNVAVDGQLLRANQRFCEMLGYSHEEVIGRHYYEFTHRDDVRSTRDLYDGLLADRHCARSLEKRYLRKDGQVVWGNLTLSLLLDDETRPKVIVAVIEDITARKQAEETFDAVPDLVFVTDGQQRIIRANRATVQRLGVSREDILGRRCREIIRGGAALPGSHSHEQLAAVGQPHQFETHEPHLDGDFLVSCTPLHDSRGELMGMVHVARDVTDLLRSQAALRGPAKSCSSGGRSSWRRPWTGCGNGMPSRSMSNTRIGLPSCWVTRPVKCRPPWSSSAAFSIQRTQRHSGPRWGNT